jgi:hypothetical protein
MPCGHWRWGGAGLRLKVCRAEAATALSNCSCNEWAVCSEEAVLQEPDTSDANTEPAKATHRVRLPRFIVHEPVGMGQIVKRVTSAAGVKPCEPCERRARQLDRWLRVEPRE